MVRTLPFHGEDTGSIPVKDLILVNSISLKNIFYNNVPFFNCIR